MTDDARWMARALELARLGAGQTWPRPSVGCVIVRDGAAVGEGRTQSDGPHAEAMALAAAGARARGATVYVTLEPCAHHGRTPPCAEALAAAGVARVVAALEDPDPRVSGRGFAVLRTAGIRVDIGEGADEAATHHAGFLMRATRGRPWVTLKLAQSLDGRIALSTGESRWITGAEARAAVHRLRATSDAVLIGAGTARADDPSLDARLDPAPLRQPVRIVADPGLSLPLTSKLAQTAAEQPLWLLHAKDGIDPARAQVLRDLGAGLHPVPVVPEAGLDLAAALQVLGDCGLTRVLCEGGGRLAAGLLAAGLVDEVLIFTAGLVIGGDGLASVGPMGAGDLPTLPRWRLAEVQRVGDDLMSRWLPPTGSKYPGEREGLAPRM